MPMPVHDDCRCAEIAMLKLLYWCCRSDVAVLMAIKMSARCLNHEFKSHVQLLSDKSVVGC